MARAGRQRAESGRPEPGGHDGAPAAAELSTEVVHDGLRRAILRGEFDPKVPLSQVKLAARLAMLTYLPIRSLFTRATKSSGLKSRSSTFEFSLAPM